MSSDAQWSPKHQWRWVNLYKMAFFAIRIWAIQSIIFWKSIRATWLNPFILFQVSGGQDEELAAKLICLYGAYNEEDPSYSTPGKLNSSSFMCHWAAFIGMNGAPSPNAVSRFYLLHPWKANSENQRVSDFFFIKKTNKQQKLLHYFSQNSVSILHNSTYRVRSLWLLRAFYPSCPVRFCCVKLVLVSHYVIPVDDLRVERGSLEATLVSRGKLLACMWRQRVIAHNRKQQRSTTCWESCSGCSAEICCPLFGLSSV